MEILHQVGHFYKWNLDAFFKHDVGDGFVFCTYNFPNGKIGGRLSTYDAEKYMPYSLIDPQYYGNTRSKGIGNFESYPFHPANYTGKEPTTNYGPENIIDAVNYQHALGLEKIIVPMYFYDYDGLDALIALITSVNKLIGQQKIKDKKYYLTLPLSNRVIKDSNLVQQILVPATDRHIIFDGYYVICDPAPAFRKKISSEPAYYKHLTNVFRTLKLQGFETIYGYANFDALVFAAATDIDYVTIATFENLRQFNLNRYTEKGQGGPSEGWYYSQKLLNFIKAQSFRFIRDQGHLALIQNQRNIFSDTISNYDYEWNSQKPDIHKNYLLAVSQQFHELENQGSHKGRIRYLIDKIEIARDTYERLNDKGIVLLDAEGDEHLSTWLSFLQPLAK